MFGLTPRAQKSRPLPPQDQQSENLTPIDAASARDEQRLAEALKTVLAKQPPTHHLSPAGSGTPLQADRVDIMSPTLGNRATDAPRKAPDSLGVIEREGQGFSWTTTNSDEPHAQSTSKISKRWLKRARRQSRLARLRRGTQWILLTIALSAAVAVAIWPSST